MTNNIIRDIILLQKQCCLLYSMVFLPPHGARPVVRQGHANRRERMQVTFNATAALLDALVLSSVEQKDSYGYKITQDVRSVMDVSESTLYPVLRRLQKDGCLAAYDQEYAGRNRRYYTITPQGEERLRDCREEWSGYRGRIENLLFGEAKDE